MDKSYRDLFFGESQEYIREINKALVSLEKNPQDREALNIIFRLMHTLKGMAATMGYEHLSSFAHRLEDVFDFLRTGKMVLSAKTMDVIFESIDSFAAFIDKLKEDETASLDVSYYENKLDEILPKEQKKEEKKAKKEVSAREEVKLDAKSFDEFKKQGYNIFSVDIRLTKDCPMKGVRALLILSRARDIGSILQISPPEDFLKDEEFENSFNLLLATKAKQERTHHVLLKIAEVETVDISRVESLPSQKSGAADSQVYLKKIQSIRIPAERLDKIMNLTGELSIVKSRLVQTVKTKEEAELEETIYLVERLVSSLQDEALKMRLLPISYILDSFPRIVRDLARKENKDVDLEIVGSEIELDRMILDEIGDPLLHLIRNSIGHGIESPEDRRKEGKSVQGKISIKVFREKGHIMIEVTDDGRGINLEEVVRRAVDKNLISPEAAAKVEPRDIVDILTTPGFSTREEVTDVSGRGVGLDAVKNKLDMLGGRLDLDSVAGKRTSFMLTLPLTLAIIKAMLVQVGTQIYAIPLMNIRETVKIRKEEIKFIKDVEVITLRDEIIPLLRLDRELGVVSGKGQDEELSAVIVEGRTESLGLVIDQVIGEQDIVVKPLAWFVKKVKGITGATILGDGRVALILDVVNIR